MNSMADILSSKQDDFLNTNQTLENNQQPVEENSDIDNNPKSTDQMKTMLYSMRDQIDTMLRMINGEKIKTLKQDLPEAEILEGGEQIIEGVFNGEKMIGPDGKEYSVPPNYASKSKLVEGDMMKLTITNQGKFIYKQISPIERKRIVGELTQDEQTAQWQVLAEGKPYKILTASVTFYKGKSGDEVVILVPESGESSWGAVENIISKN